MNSGPTEDSKGRSMTRREFIFWHGCVQFGGFTLLMNTGYDLMHHSERYMPLWPLTGEVYLRWFTLLTFNFVVSLIAGFLFGLVMWAIFTRLKTSREGVSSD